jgi:hypothetical protein
MTMGLRAPVGCSSTFAPTALTLPSLMAATSLSHWRCSRVCGQQQARWREAAQGGQQLTAAVHAGRTLPSLPLAQL